MADFWQYFIHEIRFLYGMVFFVLGLAIVLQPRRGSVYYLATALSWLAAFALIHSAGDWLLLAISVHGEAMHADALRLLFFLRTIIIIISFGFLMQFGLALLLQRNPWRSWAWVLVWPAVPPPGSSRPVPFPGTSWAFRLPHSPRRAC